MARIESLGILLTDEGKDYLAELYGKVIENIEKGTISHFMKNTDLSGDPASGSVEAKRFAFEESKPYGTARAAGKGDNTKAKPVTVQIDQDEELVAEMEYKDTTLYGVDDLIDRRIRGQTRSAIRKLEKAFFEKAASEAMSITGTATNPQEMFEEEVLAIETIENDFVSGVPRNMIHVIKSPTAYSKIRQWINTSTNNANVSTNVEEFGTLNGVNVYSSIDMPAGVDTIVMCEGSVAQPVIPKGYDAEKVPLSNAYAVELFYSFGTTNVMPELIAKRLTEAP